MYAQMAWAQLCANRVQQIERSSRVHAPCYVTCHVVRRNNSAIKLFEFNSHLFELYVTGWTINRWRSGGNQSTRRKPLATSFIKCHILKPKDLRPKQDWNLYNSIGVRPGKQTCYPLHHMSPQRFSLVRKATVRISVLLYLVIYSVQWLFFVLGLYSP